MTAAAATSSKNGNGKFMTVFLSLGTLIAGLGIGWGTKTAAIEANGAAINDLRKTVTADHDCLVELKTQLPEIRRQLDDIQRMLREKTP